MGIGSIKALGSIDPRSAYGTGGATAPVKRSFAEQLQNAVREVDDLQARRETMVQDMVAGRATEAFRERGILEEVSPCHSATA